VDILPHVQLGPVRDREDADRFALVFLGVIEIPQLGPLVLRIPPVAGRAEREDALLGPALFLVAPRTAKGGIEAPLVECLLQPLGLPHIGVERAVVERVDAALLGFGVVVDQQLHAAFLGHPVAQTIHILELPGRVHVQQRERRRRRVERLARKVQHHCTVLAHGIQHHRTLRLGHDLADDVDRLGLEPFEMGEGLAGGVCHRITSVCGRVLRDGDLDRRIPLPYGSKCYGTVRFRP